MLLEEETSEEEEEEELKGRRGELEAVERTVVDEAASAVVVGGWMEKSKSECEML